MKVNLKFLIFAGISAMIGFSCGINQTMSTAFNLTVCIIFSLLIACAYAINVKLYNEYDVSDSFENIFDFFEEDEKTTRESIGKPFTFKSENEYENIQSAQ